ncbi:MAG: hypothetical protein GX075_05290 [Firmicutes bacterium]|nr:hypothetical protein [Bacillota bacterium]
MKKIMVFMIAAAIVFSLTPVTAGDRWELILTDQLAEYYFDPETVKIMTDHASNQIYLEVRVKALYNETGRETYRQSLARAEIPTPGYQKFSYTINHLLFKDEEVCLLGVYDYSDAGAVLRSYDAPFRRWMDIIPGSTIEAWYDGIIAYMISNIIKEPSKTSGV